MSPFPTGKESKRVSRLLVVGAGEAGQSLVREIVDEGLAVTPVAFLDDKPELVGQEICGLPVLGGTADLPEVARQTNAEEILIAIPSASGALIRRLVLLCRRCKLPFKIVPGIRAIIEGDVHFDQIRPVAPEDLLGRESVTFRAGSARELVAGRRVLVTGAGGSIGSELCRQLLALEPSDLYLLGRGENSLFEIDAELKTQAGDTRLHTMIADIRDGQRLEVLASRHQPQLILHAAAHKHVPLMEDNPEEAVMVNVLGTMNMVRFAHLVNAERFVLISTDKAVTPGSVMGATKKVAELLVQRIGAESTSTHFLTVRFGNVLGSRGSVVPLFMQRIEAGLPLPITDARMTRYFMTIKEAVLLVIEAMVLGKSGATYILEMGEPIPIIELANNLLALSGYDPHNGDEGPGIEITGKRPGERLHETLVADDEDVTPSNNPLIKQARPRELRSFDLDSALGSLIQPAVAGDRDGVRQALSTILGHDLASAAEDEEPIR